jgi:hypothetical protein
MTNAVDPMLAEIRKLAPEIASRAAEIEAARRFCTGPIFARE